MKTPDEIKKALQCCMVDVEKSACTDYGHCPYYFVSAHCDTIMHGDALEYIQQLEAENARQHEKIRAFELSQQAINATNIEQEHKIWQLEAERDAAVADLKYVAACETCKEFQRSALTEPCLHCTKYGLLDSENKYEWRGVQKED